VPPLRDSAETNLSLRGAYVIWESRDKPKVIVIATGSEVQLAIKAAKELDASGIPTRVVSMPEMQIFEAQPPEYRRTLLPEDAIKIGIEAGVPFGWAAHLGQKGRFIGMHGFGASAPFDILFEHFGITAAAVVAAARAALEDGEEA
jgi:transketolase